MNPKSPERAARPSGRESTMEAARSARPTANRPSANANPRCRVVSPSTARRPDSAGWHLRGAGRSEEHTSEIQSQSKLVCRLLLGKKNIDSLYFAGLVQSTTTRHSDI